MPSLGDTLNGKLYRMSRNQPVLEAAIRTACFEARSFQGKEHKELYTEAEEMYNTADIFKITNVISEAASEAVPYIRRTYHGRPGLDARGGTEDQRQASRVG